MELGVGDCFNEQDVFGGFTAQDEEVSDVPLVDCAEPHDSEIFYSEELPDGDFPGDAALEKSLDDICTGSAFEKFVGIDYMDSELYVGAFQPTAETWDLLDDRETLCYVVTGGETVTGSLEGSKR